jgi:hypothetical protein
VLRSSSNQYKQRLKDDALEKVTRKPRGGKAKATPKEKAKAKGKWKAGAANAKVNTQLGLGAESLPRVGATVEGEVEARAENGPIFEGQMSFEGHFEEQQAFGDYRESGPVFERQPEFEEEPEDKDEPEFESRQTFAVDSPVGNQPQFEVSVGDISMVDGGLGTLLGDVTNMSLDNNTQGQSCSSRIYAHIITTIFRRRRRRR